MSLAGTRSDQGDAYQTQVAISWAISMLNDQNIVALEVNSTAIDGGEPVQVDDVVVRHANGPTIYCQCKKNVQEFKAWTAASLSDELKKALSLLRSIPSALIHFYSRSPFGELAKLRDYADTQPNPAAYSMSLSDELRKVHLYVLGLDSAATEEKVFKLLRQTTFHHSPDFSTLEAEQLERLRPLVTSAQTVHASLWSAIDRLGAKLPAVSTYASEAQHSIDRPQLLKLVQDAGSVIAPMRSLQEAMAPLQLLSSVGRAWKRDVGGARLTRSATSQVQAALGGATRSILLTGGPGTGKSCVLLDLLDAAESDGSCFCVYMQSRSFAECRTAQDRQSAGWPADVVGSIARVAETKPVLVLMDSLDVLSVAREHQALNFFLSLVDRLVELNGVTVVATVRTFDAAYDARLATRNWDLKISLSDLDWTIDVAPLVRSWGIDVDSLVAEARVLLCNPRHLALFKDLVERGTVPVEKTHFALTRKYLEVVVRQDPALGDAALRSLEELAAQMLRRRSLAVAPVRANLDRKVEAGLLSVGVVQLTGRGTLEFTHQTLLDVLAIGSWERTGRGLQEFVASLPAVPFVRPTIRAYVLTIAAIDRKELRTHVRGIASANVPHHLSRLVVETYADLEPEDEDWPMVRWLLQKPSLFLALFGKANTLLWHHFWFKYLAPLAWQDRDGSRLIHLAHRAESHMLSDGDRILAFWLRVLETDWIDRSHFAMWVAYKIGEYRGPPRNGIGPLVLKLVQWPKMDHDSVGAAVMNAVNLGCVSDDVLWQYIAGSVDEDAVTSYGIDNALRCDSHTFGDDQLANRMRASDDLLNLAITTVEEWRRSMEARYRSESAWEQGQLRSTSYETDHREGPLHISNDDLLFRAIEAGVLERAREKAPWWQTNKKRLAESREGAMRFWVVEALTVNPLLDLEMAAELASQASMLDSMLSHEMGEMIRVKSPHWSVEQLERIHAAINAIEIPQDHRDHYRAQRCRLIKAMPSCYRSPDLQAELDQVEERLGTVHIKPDIHSSGGWVTPPFGMERFLEADDEDVIRLLKHYQEGKARDWGDFVGGSEHVGYQLADAASRAPTRFLNLLRDRWPEIPDRFRSPIVDGCSSHLGRRSGVLQDPGGTWRTDDTTGTDVLSAALLDELERHPCFWEACRSKAKALEALSYCIDLALAPRVAFQLMAFRSGDAEFKHKDPVVAGLNSKTGEAASAAAALLIRLLDEGNEVPPLLLSALRAFSGLEDSGPRAMILRRLAYIIHKDRPLGLDLFERCMTQASPALWKVAEPCLYHSYHAHFEWVAPSLKRLLLSASSESDDASEQPGADRQEKDPKAMATWSRISALSSLTGHIELRSFIETLRRLNDVAAWRGAVGVWSCNMNIVQHEAACVEGIVAALSTESTPPSVVTEIDQIFDLKQGRLAVPDKLIELLFRKLGESKSSGGHYFAHDFGGWLESTALANPEAALSAFEHLMRYLEGSGRALYDRGHAVRALTSLYREAEERELEDGGSLLTRVASLQDRLSRSISDNLDKWLNAAERP
ncbi:AAA family ATPase [Piscinibacter gummiphilus]|uniref:AAA family ATPase n=1 Tax=Piscinibacter gummiphilus TaxID=946333 RepID=A0ABZ0CTM6_9BURK|nr:AAA family ATPase [Piscinibacter gummiphilus]WOB05894.1 AAA family ATPase [Piscinibacter gummiphilus]